jgi:hypothetical protein
LPVLLFDTIFLWFIIKTLNGSAYQQINSLLIYPLFKIFVSNTSLNYYYPKRRALLEQADCIYVKKTSILEKKIAILIGWGFIQEAFELYKKNPTKLKNKCKNKLKKFFCNLKII